MEGKNKERGKKMTLTNSHNATRATLIHNDEFVFEINPLIDTTKESLEAFNLPAAEEKEKSPTRATLHAGPISVTLSLPADGEEGTRVEIRVAQLRESETLHPEATTAILAEILSLLAERTGGDLVEWADAGVTIDAARFVASFTPLRRRGGATRISPRRISRGDTSGTPIMLPVRRAPSMDNAETCDAFRDIFAHEELDQQESASGLTSVSAWAATASVGVMNPVIGIPLAAYNLTRGADIRVSTHAFALTATLSGVIGSTFGHLPFF
jgi:hypothetical protein